MSDVWDPDTEIEENRHNWSGEPKHYPPLDAADRDESRPKVIDLFCGPGGISTGLERAGFEPVLGVDLHEPSIETYRRNHRGAHTILGDIRRINKRSDDERDIIDVIESDEEPASTMLSEVAETALNGDDLRLLTAGIPCQGFSIANRKQHDDDERNYLFEEFIRGVRLLNPEYVLIENVSTMKAADDGGFVEAIEDCLERLGYRVDHRILNAADFGVPQKRRRLFFLGTRTDAPILWPEPTHEDDHRTAAEALSDLPSLEAGETDSTYTANEDARTAFQSLMREKVDPADALWNHGAPNHQQTTVDRVESTDPGEPMYDRFRQRIRLHPDEPGPTIIAGGIRPQFQYGHYEQSRGLSVRERARLQSFPDCFEFEGGTVQGRVQTGMAVPPLLAEAIGNSIRMAADAAFFVDTLLDEYEERPAVYPWRTDDASPFEVLVGELLFRRAAAASAIDAYDSLLEEYPDREALSAATQETVEDMLEAAGVDGSVARELRDVLSQVVFSGIPNTEERLLELPHVGRSVANAVLCFGHGQRYPLIGSDVARVYQRFFDLGVDERAAENEYVRTLATNLLPEDDYGRYNRGLTRFAAGVCTADAPDCETCPVASRCRSPPE